MDMHKYCFIRTDEHGNFLLCNDECPFYGEEEERHYADFGWHFIIRECKNVLADGMYISQRDARPEELNSYGKTYYKHEVERYTKQYNKSYSRKSNEEV